MARADRLANLLGRGPAATPATPPAPPRTYVKVAWPEPQPEAAPELNGHALNGHAAKAKDTHDVGPGMAPVQGNAARDLVRGSMLLVIEKYRHRTGRLKLAAWGVWLDLYHEAHMLGLERRIPHLELAIGTSPSVEGWGQLRLVEALRGEVKAETMPPTGYIGASAAPQQQPAPTTVVVTNGQAAEQPKKRGLLGRIRG